MIYDLPLYIGLSCILLSNISSLLAFYTSYGWRKRKFLIGFSLITNAFGVGIFIAQIMSYFGILLGFISIYVFINYLRIFEARMHDEYLKQSTNKSYIYLLFSQIVVLIFWKLSNMYHSDVSVNNVLGVYLLILVCISLILFIYALYNVYKTRPVLAKNISDNKFPTVTLAIAARNENSDLQQCITYALDNDYPKLEIIVIDDCSQDRTAEIIKSFAHEGVRFIKGTESDKTWLAKNKSYQTLLEQASGEIVMYMGVDVIMHPQSIRRLVEEFIDSQVLMMSVLPKRTDSGLIAAFIQPMRYWWELVIPKIIVKRPPVLSTVWLANRKALNKMGGFKSVTRAIIPEEHLSKEFNKSQTYKFIRSNKYIGINTHKDFLNQWLTAIRTRYPQVHRKPEKVMFISLAMLIFLICPFIIFFVGIFGHLSLTNFYLSIITIVFLTLSSVVISIVTNPIASIIGLVNFSVMVLLDIAALNISMYKYEFSEVTWRGRNVSIPAMHVYPHLPEIK